MWSGIKRLAVICRGDRANEPVTAFCRSLRAEAARGSPYPVVIVGDHEAAPSAIDILNLSLVRDREDRLLVRASLARGSAIDDAEGSRLSRAVRLPAEGGEAGASAALATLVLDTLLPWRRARAATAMNDGRRGPGQVHHLGN